MARKQPQHEGALITARGAIGQNVQELARLAREAEALQCGITLAAGAEQYHVGLRQSRSEGLDLALWRETSEESVSVPVDAPSFEQGMLTLANLCPKGELKLDSVNLKLEGCSLRVQALRHLVIMAWCEVFGVPVPTKEELVEKDRAEKAGLRKIHEEMLEDLRGGAAGVKRWNGRTQKVRAKVGHFRALDLAGQTLAGITLSGLDFQQTIFDRADLRKARLKECDLRQASFKEAKLDGADLTWAKLADADFTGASLTGCKLWTIKNLRRARFQGADLSGVRFVSSDLRTLCFQGTNLSKADLSYCHLQGADLSEANLEGCKLNHAHFDDQTRLPRGFRLPKGLTWVGKGPDPRGSGAT